MKSLILVLIICLLSNITLANQYYQVTTEKLNIRKGPNKNEEVIGNSFLGDSIIVISISNHWAKVLIDSQKAGYVNAKYLSTNFKGYKRDRLNRKKDDSKLWLYFIILIGIGIAFKYFKSFSKSETKTNRNNESYSQSQPKNENYILELKYGNVRLIKEGTTGSTLLYNYGDIIYCDLENSKNRISRFLAVTSEGNILLCDTNHTGRKKIYDFYRNGKAISVRFSSADSFIFETYKGMFKGYFNSTKTDKLG